MFVVSMHCLKDYRFLCAKALRLALASITCIGYTIRYMADYQKLLQYQIIAQQDHYVNQCRYNYFFIYLFPYGQQKTGSQFGCRSCFSIFCFNL